MLLAKSPGAVLVTLEPAHQILTEADEGADAGAGPAPDSQAGTPCWSSDGSWLWGIADWMGTFSSANSWLNKVVFKAFYSEGPVLARGCCPAWKFFHKIGLCTAFGCRVAMGQGLAESTNILIFSVCSDVAGGAFHSHNLWMKLLILFKCRIFFLSFLPRLF